MIAFIHIDHFDDVSSGENTRGVYLGQQGTESEVLQVLASRHGVHAEGYVKQLQRGHTRGIAQTASFEAQIAEFGAFANGGWERAYSHNIDHT
jgi:hypothetical protein